MPILTPPKMERILEVYMIVPVLQLSKLRLYQ